MKRDTFGPLAAGFEQAFGGSYAGRRVLVTGHTGFKGSWLVLWLKCLGAEVSGLALPAEGSLNHSRLLDLPLQQALVDLRDAATVRGAMARFQPDIVFHLAAQPLVRRSYREPVATWDTNVMGLVHVLEAVRATASVRAVVNVTSDKCYQQGPQQAAFIETDRLGGHDPYSASKACAEIVSQSYRASFLAHDDGRGHAVALVTARAGNVIGGGDWGEDRLVPDLMRAAAAGRFTAIRSPQAVRPWQHVLDPLAGYLMLGQRLLDAPGSDGGAWNFGPPAADHLSVGELVSRLSTQWPAVQCEVDTRAQPHEAAWLALDCGKARRELGWRAVWGMDSVLARTAHWYRQWYDHGQLRSHDDLCQYLGDARRLGLPWAAPAQACAAAVPALAS